MTDFYAILGISKSASSSIIRNAFRRLAKKYHPDVNKEAYAEDFFKKINEAYEVLGDPQKRALYDGLTYSSEPVTPQQPPPIHRDRAYRKPRPGQQAYENDTQRLKRLSEEYKIWFVWFCRVGLAFSLLIGLDVVFPSAVSEEVIVDAHYLPSRSTTRLELRTNLGRWVTLYPDTYNKLGEIKIRGTIYLELSPLLSTVLSIRNQGAAISVWIARLYTTLSFFPIVLFMTSVLGEMLKGKTEMAFNCGTISFVLTLICLALIIFQ